MPEIGMKRTSSSVGACAVAAVIADALCLTYFAPSFPAVLAATGAVLVGCSVWPRGARRQRGRRRGSRLGTCSVGAARPVVCSQRR